MRERGLIKKNRGEMGCKGQESWYSECVRGCDDDGRESALARSCTVYARRFARD